MRWLVYFLMVASLPIASAQVSTGTDALIEQLGADTYKERVAANKKVRGLGFRALPALRRASTHEDPEVQLRANDLVAAILKEALKELQVLGTHPGAGHKKWATRSMFTPDGKFLITGSLSDIRVWNLETGKLGKVFNHRSETWSLNLSPDGSRLAVGGSPAIRLFDWQQGKLTGKIFAHENSVWGAQFDAKGEHMISVAKDKQLVVWNLAENKSVKNFELPGRGRALELMPDGKTALITVFESEHVPGTVQLWDVEAGKALRVFKGHKKSPASFELSPDRRVLATASFDATIRLWEFATGAPLKTIEAHKDGVEDVAFSPDGFYLLSCGTPADPTVRLWDVKTGKELHCSRKQPHGMISLTFAPDGKRFVTTGKDGSVRLWQFGIPAK